MPIKVPALFLLTLCATPALELDAAELRVEIRGQNGDAGQINVGLSRNADGFPDIRYAGVRIPAHAAPAVAVFSGLPAGNYAVSAYHDENGNEQLDKNLLGLPTERYGFSRDARGRLGPPAFDDAKITLGEDDQSIVINLD